MEEVVVWFGVLLKDINSTYFWTGGFVTGSVDTYNKFSQNPSGRYLLTKKLQANHSLELLVVVQHQMEKILVVDTKDRVWQQEIY